MTEAKGERVRNWHCPYQDGTLKFISSQGGLRMYQCNTCKLRVVVL